MRYGLVGAGPVNEYFVAKLPRLKDELGPVAASSHRLASRIVNTLRAGEPKGTLAELAGMRTILICAPNHHLKALLPMLNDPALEWENKSLVFCNSNTFSREMDHLRERGAAIASLRGIAGMPHKYLVEGDRTALHAAGHLVGQMRGSVLHIEPEKYLLYCAAMTFASSLFTPIIDGSMAAMRGAGISAQARAQMLEALFQQGLRMYLYSGRKSWSGTVADGNERGMAREAEALAALQPELAHLYRQAADAATFLLKKTKAAKGPDIG
jgi:hypothetical protein